jgi:hypothetical protein
MDNTIVSDSNNIASIFDWILRLVGIFALILNFIALFLKHNKRDVNVYIDRINKTDLSKYKNAKIFIDENGNGEYLLFLPQGKTHFMNVKYCGCEFNGKKVKTTKELQCFYNIVRTNGLIINTYFPCGTPSRLLKWETIHVTKGKYVIYENGKDGNIKFGKKIYLFFIRNFISNVKKIFDFN